MSPESGIDSLGSSPVTGSQGSYSPSTFSDGGVSLLVDQVPPFIGEEFLPDFDGYQIVQAILDKDLDKFRELISDPRCDLSMKIDMGEDSEISLIDFIVRRYNNHDMEENLFNDFIDDVLKVSADNVAKYAKESEMDPYFNSIVNDLVVRGDVSGLNYLRSRREMANHPDFYECVGFFVAHNAMKTQRGSLSSLNNFLSGDSKNLDFIKSFAKHFRNIISDYELLRDQRYVDHIGDSLINISQYCEMDDLVEVLPENECVILFENFDNYLKILDDESCFNLMFSILRHNNNVFFRKMFDYGDKDFIKNIKNEKGIGLTIVALTLNNVEALRVMEDSDHNLGDKNILLDVWPHEGKKRR